MPHQPSPPRARPASVPLASAALASAALTAARRGRRLVRDARLLVALERRQHVGALHPSLWRRGFLSNRRYAYPGLEDRSLPFVSDVAVELRMVGINALTGRALLEDKNVFADALVARGLADRAPEVYGAVAAGTFRPRSAAAAQRLREQPLVVLKPVAGAGGRGVQVVAGAAVEGADHPARPDLVVQQRLEQHEVLHRINPASLNTLRVLALRLPGDEPVVAAAVHRWGTAATGAVDNVSSGALCSPVDLATGRLGPAVGRPLTRARLPVDEHPDTGERITGVVVPQWEQVRQLALDLMRAFPEVDHVGWDLCVTPDGPRVVEGNPGVPNLNVFQFHGPFLHDPRVRRFYIEHRMLDASYA